IIPDGLTQRAVEIPALLSRKDVCIAVLIVEIHGAGDERAPGILRQRPRLAALVEGARAPVGKFEVRSAEGAQIGGFLTAIFRRQRISIIELQACHKVTAVPTRTPYLTGLPFVQRTAGDAAAERLRLGADEVTTRHKIHHATDAIRAVLQPSTLR